MPDRMKRVTLRALLVLSGVAGCLDSSDSADVTNCFSIEDCEAGNICFLGNCVDPGYSITTVYAELTPPSSSPWLQQQNPNPLNLAHGFQELSLRAAVTLRGELHEERATGTSMTGMLRASSSGSIPGLEVVRLATVSSTGFSLQLLPDTYTLTFTPDVGGVPTGCGNTAAKPPFDYGETQILTSLPSQLFVYPPADDLVTVCGRVLPNAAVNTGTHGARVVGTSTSGGRSVRSGEASTDEDGLFAIAFPPGSSVFDLHVGPGSNQDVPDTVFPGVTITGPPSGIDDLVLGIEPPIAISAVVYDDNHDPVQDAAILFEGQVGQGTYTVVGATNTRGAVECQDAPCSLIPGTYTVTVAPLEVQRYAITSTKIEVPDPNPPVVVTVRNKVHVTGFVSSHAGQPVVGATVRLTLRDSPTRRDYSTVTDGSGWYTVDVDPGEPAEPADYDLVVETEPTSGLPWYYALLKLEDADRRADVTLYEPSFAYGRVVDPIGNPLADTFIAFYSLDLEIREGEPLLVGVVQSSATGEFALPVPTPNGS